MKLDKVCKKCEADDWYIFSSGSKVCRPCKLESNRAWYEKNPGKRSEYVKRWQSKNPTHARNAHLKRNYGITMEEQEDIFNSQGRVCAVCQSKEPNASHGKWVVDHNHETKQVRGVLCHKCNVALGLVNDNVEILDSMVRYLQEGAEGIRKRVGL